MGCPGGCINGGGQSYVNAMIRNSGFDFKGARAKALYDEDRAMPARKSHKNTQIQKLYEDFLGHPNSHLHIVCCIQLMRKKININNRKKGSVLESFLTNFKVFINYNEFGDEI